MKASLSLYRGDTILQHPKNDTTDDSDISLVLCFGSKLAIQTRHPFALLRKKYPAAQIAICSTAGEIFNTGVYDDTLSVTAISFQHTKVDAHTVETADYTNSYDAGRALLQKFDTAGLSYLMILSDGSHVNGTELVRGLNEASHYQLLITGGLAGDGADFQSTLVGLNAAPKEGVITAIGFYGNKIIVRHGTQGGWETIGPERLVTNSDNNVLYEIDGKNALDIYKRYLGPDADSLPGSALLFPLSVKHPDMAEAVVRTILSIGEEKGSMTFAGDIPVGSQVRFMKANFDKLTNAASAAALQTRFANEPPPKLALLVSCVGRKLILQSRTEEEVEAIDEIFKQQTLLTGFYSYGELSPFISEVKCQLHNQTMTITTFDETE
jgi:hypothetical protein